VAVSCEQVSISFLHFFPSIWLQFLEVKINLRDSIDLIPMICCRRGFQWICPLKTGIFQACVTDFIASTILSLAIYVRMFLLCTEGIFLEKTILLKAKSRRAGWYIELRDFFQLKI
jgi:hypothetical protein